MSSALFLLLAINLFNYIDRQILAALEPNIRATFFSADDVNAMTKTGFLAVAFFVTYMVSAPILGLLAEGLTNPQIGSRLYVSERTVAHHVSAVLQKLGQPNRSAAVAVAVRQGILPTTDQG